MDKVSSVINVLAGFFKQNYILSAGVSGKDSLCVAHCAIEALKQAREEDPSCQGELYISTTNTTLDNFEVHNLVMKLHTAALEYGQEYDLPIHSAELKPKLMSRPVVEYIGRGKLLRTMVTASRGRDCAVDWKINPCKDYLKELSQKYQTDKIVSISGTRDSESSVRARNIAKRRESIDVLAKTDLGLTLAPIKDWDIKDVWGLIGKIENDEIESFAADLAGQLIKVYGAGNNGTCDIFAGNNKASDKACGARFGCVLCSFSKEDKSLQNQISIDPDTYSYMKPFVDLRKFMNDTLFDMERSRSILGRDVKNGSWLKVGYNQYGLEYRKELLRYMLTIDVNERIYALENGVAPRFEMIGYDELIAIQYHWSREGAELRPAEAISIWHEVHTYGKRYSIPETSDVEFSATELNFSNLNFIAGAKQIKYRYVDMEDLKGLFESDTDFCGLGASHDDSNFFNCHKKLLDGKMTNTIPFKETRSSTVDSDRAQNYIEDTYFYLESEGAFDPENNMCPTIIIKDMLFNEVITLRKGMANKLHQDLKRAQLYNAITQARAFGSSSVVDSVVLARSINEDEYEERIEAMNDAAIEEAPQMVMGF